MIAWKMCASMVCDALAIDSVAAGVGVAHSAGTCNAHLAWWHWGACFALRTSGVRDA